MSRVRALLLNFSEKSDPTYYGKPTVRSLEFSASVVVVDQDGGANLRYSGQLWGDENSGIAVPSDVELQDFGLRFWLSDDFESLTPYGVTYAYFRPSEVNLERASGMAKTLKRVEGFLDRKRRLDGYSETTGQFTAWVAQSIRASHMLREQDPGLYGAFRVMGLGDGANWINARVATWQAGVRERRTQTVEVTA